MTQSSFTSALSVEETILPYQGTLPAYESLMDASSLETSDLSSGAQTPMDSHEATRFQPLHLTLNFTDFSSCIIHRLPLPDSTPEQNEIFSRVVQPYNAGAFESLLKEHKLDSRFPYLVKNLCHGFPLGALPILHSTVIIPNHPSVDNPENLPVVLEYIETEKQAGRMSGPYSKEQVERILRGPFFCLPFIVAVQDQPGDLPKKRRVCRNLSKGDRISGMPSVNSFILKEDFPTRFDMAIDFADIMSPLSSNPLSTFSLKPFYLNSALFWDISRTSAFRGHFSNICPFGTFLGHLPFGDTHICTRLASEARFRG